MRASARGEALLFSTRADDGARHGSRAGRARHAFPGRGTPGRARVHMLSTHRACGSPMTGTSYNVYVCEIRVSLLKPMSCAVVLYHVLATPLIGAAQRAREPRETREVNNPDWARCARQHAVYQAFSRGPGAGRACLHAYFAAERSAARSQP